MIHNCEEKIIRQTIRLGAKYGIGPQLSTKKIANACRFSEATVFVHFGTKENLLLATFIKIGRDIGAAIAPYTSLDAEHLYDSAKRMWDAFMDYLVANPDDAKYYCLYRLTPAYNAADHAQQDQFFSCLLNFASYLNTKMPAREGADFNATWTLLIDSSLRVAQMLIDGKIPNTPQSRDFVFDLLFGILRGAFSPIKTSQG